MGVNRKTVTGKNVKTGVTLIGIIKLILNKGNAGEVQFCIF